MITAVDTCVLLDLLQADSPFHQLSKRALALAKQDGRLIVCECVVAEIGPALGGKPEEFLADLEVDFLPGTQECALLAARSFHRYIKSGGRRGRIIADHLIAAHASLLAERLLTRDKGFKRASMPRVTVWYP